ncbi:MAG: tetratricopeptide repeat protein [Planctomycetota bacterium]|jgi:hypothetical protein
MDPLADTPVTALDDSWLESVRALDVEAAQAMLREADALRDRDGIDRVRALAGYRGLAALLDPETDEGRDRMQWVFENDPVRDDVIGELAHRGTGSSHVEFQRLSVLVFGQVATEAGKLEEAESLLRTLLSKDFSLGSRTERLAALALARVFALQRRGFEALVMARVAAGLARKAGSPWDLCLARSRICMAFQVLADRQRLEAALDELERSLLAIPRDRALPLDMTVQAARAEAAIDEKNAAAAREALDKLKTLIPERGPRRGDARLPDFLEAQVLLLEERAAEALQAVERARALPTRVAASDLALLMLEARCRLISEGKEAARAPAHEVLRRLEGVLETDNLGTGQRIRYATVAGHFLMAEGEDEEAANRAFDLAADVVIERILEVDRTLDELPGLRSVASDDLRALGDYRNRYVEEQPEILDRLAAFFLESTPRNLVRPSANEEDETFFNACAWCRRIRNTRGVWLPIGQFVPDNRGMRVSHGICPGCQQRWLESMGNQ